MENFIFLASTSQRRKEIFEWMGIPFKCVHPLQKKEIQYPGETAVSLTQRLAVEKGKSVLKRCKGKWILSADTVVTIQNEVFGKPDTCEHAQKTLMKLRGQEHRVVTSVALLVFTENWSIYLPRLAGFSLKILVLTH